MKTTFVIWRVNDNHYRLLLSTDFLTFFASK